MGIESNLARIILRTKFGDIPSDIIEITKRHILDTLGVCLAGSKSKGCSELVDLMKESGEKKGSTILVFGHQVPSFCAALVNSTMAHAHDFDDTYDQSPLHAGVSVIPASLAITEELGQVSGKDFITAIVLGVDLLCRMGLASTWGIGNSGFVFTATYGYFGSSAAVSKLLGLDEDGILNALGIAYSQTSGNLQCILDGALTKRLQPAFGSMAGVLSAKLAKAGITGAKNFIQGKYGYYNVYEQGHFDASRFMEGMGKTFEGRHLSFKPYPCCRHTHAAIESVLEMVKKNDLRPEEIEEIVTFVTKHAYDIVCQPYQIKSSPRGVVDAQFSIPYTVATAVIKRRVSLDDFSEEAIRDKTILEMAKKVKPIFDPNLEAESGKEVSLTKVRIQTKDGRCFEERRTVIKGHPQNPMTVAEMVEKFKFCASFAARELSQGSIENIIQMVQELEKLDDVNKLIPFLVGKGR